MALLLRVPPPATTFFSVSSSSQFSPRIPNQIRGFSCRSSDSSDMVVKSDEGSSKLEYKPGILDNFFLHSFRNKLIEEVGSDSEKPGYDGLIELVKLLLLSRQSPKDLPQKFSSSTSFGSNADMYFSCGVQVRILKSFFPPLILELYKLLIAPIAQGKIAALMVARVTVFTCQWLMGPCKVSLVDLPNGESWSSGVYVEKCRYLEESKCVGVCINTCKIPTQRFFKEDMGVPLLMEPNFSDYSCQFKFGVLPPKDDANVNEPCLATCPIAGRRKISFGKCPTA
ncbi:PREDICTED: beta-carotene isomerase D27, chloroplastic [Tarenaya hassleriana]|uniref:beta-carotene isomerase D27, chloroplastic n=1 Tax=Tarenaya hassleriana TaxID=28532 RepID=UPI00053C2911|nr:PREDICTED: beta-carotene isomerase D27, chloroplastic [Tarenaya hassleriana]